MHLQATLLALVGIASLISGEVIVSFVELEWDWTRTQYDRNTSLANGEYIPTINSLSGLAVNAAGSRIWVSAPRVAAPTGVPAAVATVESDAYGNIVLAPYPDWQANEIGNCDAFQCAMGMTLDHRTGLLYVVDVGSTGFLGPAPRRSCPPKLMVLDTNNGGSVYRKYDFPAEVMDPNANWLNDVVLDYLDPSDPRSVARYAYMTDSIGAKLVCLDLESGESWTYSHSNMLPEPEAINITIAGVVSPTPAVINGIAMSPSFNYVYYSAIAGFNVYQVPTWVLRKNNSAQVFSDNVRSVGKKISQSDAIMFGRRNLYYGAISESAVYYWDIKADMEKQGVSEGRVNLETEVVINQNDWSVIWSDGMAFDAFGYFYYVSGKANMLGRYDTSGASGANARIFRQAIDDMHYLDFLPSFGYPWMEKPARRSGGGF